MTHPMTFIPVMGRIVGRKLWSDLMILVFTLPATVTCMPSGIKGTEPDWNQFRGPYGNGRSDVAKPPVHFDHDLNVLWKTPIHGKGWSSPVVWRDQVWITTAPEDGTKLHAVCLDLETGETKHDITVFDIPSPEFCHPSNSYASCTPFIEKGRIYTHFGTYGTACLDTQSGDLIWQRRDLHCDHHRGPASSPVVHGNLLLIHFDGVDIQFVVALDKRNGKTVWKRNRDIDYGTSVGDRKKAYGTPSLIEVGGRWQMISPAAVATMALDPATGEEFWRLYHGGMNVAARPLYENNLLYITAGSGNTRLVAMHPDGRGDVTETHIEWSTGKGVPSRSSPLIVDSRLYMVNDGGVVTCLNARNGKRLWSERLGGEYWASPVVAGGCLYVLSKRGLVTVIKAGPRFEVLAENQFPAGFNASPAISGNSLILRSFTHLYRIGERNSGEF